MVLPRSLHPMEPHEHTLPSSPQGPPSPCSAIITARLYPPKVTIVCSGQIPTPGTSKHMLQACRCPLPQKAGVLWLLLFPPA